ncbi:MAG: 16S rRNA processing protein RimM [Fimbriimonadaceae bacterium]|nr:16S rRNA processing protein RimM [Fimbriimonadaceae bacterium]
MSTPSKAPNLIPIGKIVGAFGIDGRMKIESLTDFPERFDLGKKIYIKGDEHKIKWVAWHKTQARVKLDGFTRPEDVEALVGTLVQVPADDRPDLDEDEFYTQDLIGMKVISVDGEELGELDEVLSLPAHDVLIVGEVMIPAIEEFVQVVDFDEGIITVKLIPGMRGDAEEA